MTLLLTIDTAAAEFRPDMQFVRRAIQDHLYWQTHRVNTREDYDAEQDAYNRLRMADAWICGALEGKP